MEAPPNPEEITESLKIEQDNNIYTLNFIIKGETMIINLINLKEIDTPSYSRKITLEEIKEIHKMFSLLNSFNEFLDYLKELSKINKLSIIKKGDKLSINCIIEYLLKNQDIEIILNPGKINLDTILYEEINEIKEKIKNLENENKILKEENKNLKEEINELKKIIEPINKYFKENININKQIFNINSVIMNEKDFNLISFAIKSRLNQDIKEIKKLYQATIDGDGIINFHSKCDNIPNTLTVIKSAGNRRFGGFTTQTWDSSNKYKDDIYSFLFSLDKHLIYSYKYNGKAIYCSSDLGPTFGYGNDIYIGPNVIQAKKMFTHESWSGSSYDYYGDKNALSESGNARYINAVEYEVFQIIFE